MDLTIGVSLRVDVDVEALIDHGLQVSDRFALERAHEDGFGDCTALEPVFRDGVSERMSSLNFSTGSRESDDAGREEVLSVLADQIRTVNARIEGMDPDPSDLEAQRVQIKWTRTLAYLAGLYRKLLKDTDVDEMEEDVELLRTIVDD